MEEAQRVERERALRECEAKAAEQVAAGGTGVKAPVERGMRSLWCVVAHEGPPEVGKLLTCMWRPLHRQRNMASRQGPDGWDHHKKVVQDHQPRAARTVCLAAPSYAQATRALRAHATLPVCWLVLSAGSTSAAVLCIGPMCQPNGCSTAAALPRTKSLKTGPCNALVPFARVCVRPDNARLLAMQIQDGGAWWAVWPGHLLFKPGAQEHGLFVHCTRMVHQGLCVTCVIALWACLLRFRHAR